MAKTGEGVAVLLVAYGAPNSLEEVEPYLLDVRGGRPTSPQLVEEIRQRYASIGDRSPLLEMTRAQAQAVQSRLNVESDQRFRTYIGMRHWRPYIKEAVGEIVAAGLRKVVALCLAPHYSRMSIGAYFRRLQEAVASWEAKLDIRKVEHWHDHPHFIQGLAEKVAAGLSRFPQEIRTQVPVVFTAHSLPARILQDRDPYPQQLLETAKLVAERIGLSRWQFSFQSAGQTGEPWLGPSIEETIVALAAQGTSNLLVAPIGFVAENVEVLYDLDITARGVAEEHGVHMERADLLNTSPHLISALTDIVLKTLEE